MIEELWRGFARIPTGRTPLSAIELAQRLSDMMDTLGWVNFQNAILDIGESALLSLARGEGEASFHRGKVNAVRDIMGYLLKSRECAKIDSVKKSAKDGTEN